MKPPEHPTKPVTVEFLFATRIVPELLRYFPELHFQKMFVTKRPGDPRNEPVCLYFIDLHFSAN